ncbi:hypothetical protein GCM10027074_43140 [Streptomyces deserti]
MHVAAKIHLGSYRLARTAPTPRLDGQPACQTGHQPQTATCFKSSYSGGAGGECIEVAALPHSVHIRDSKDTGRGSLTVSSDSWSAFVDHTSRRH